MARVRIKNDGVVFDMPDGARLMPYAKEHSSIMFGCGKGTCGMCICTVVKGMENLEKKTHEEHMLLASQGARPSQRLACQMVVKHGEVEIEY